MKEAAGIVLPLPEQGPDPLKGTETSSSFAARRPAARSTFVFLSHTLANENCSFLFIAAARTWGRGGVHHAHTHYSIVAHEPQWPVQRDVRSYHCLSSDRRLDASQDASSTLVEADTFHGQE